MMMCVLWIIRRRKLMIIIMVFVILAFDVYWQ